MTSVGVVGLGHMGGAMAERFLKAGYRVYGEQRDRTRAAPLMDHGLVWRDTPRQVAESADVVMTSLPDDPVLEQVASGPDGVLAGLGPGAIWLDTSTVSPQLSRDLAVRARDVGAAMLDAPVSGSVPQVEGGTLTIMVGGDASAYAQAEPILRELGKPRHVGENGEALVLKLAINLCLAVQMLTFAEGVLLAERAGLDRRQAVEIMTESAVGSPAMKGRAAFVLDPSDQAWFDIDMLHKDVRLAIDTAHDLGVPLPAAAAADEAMTTAGKLGYGQRDIAALHEVLTKIADRRVQP